MRLLTFVIALTLSGCTDAPAPEFTKVEIFAPGLQVTVNAEGAGDFEKPSEGVRGRFKLQRSDLLELHRRLEPFRRSGEALSSEEEFQAAILERCNGDYVTDNGGMGVHWLGPSIGEYYVVDFGCEPDKHALRNEKLRSILASLPVPEPVSLP